jgi:Zn/Cd-binding protein ZinT
MIKKINYLLLVLFFLSSVIATKTQAQATSKLFNQKNLKGWYAYEPVSGKQKDASKIFHAEQKMIRLYGDKIGYLMSEKSFKNFQLTLEYKWNMDSTVVRKSTKKNSGIMYLVPTTTPDTLWPKGIQFQVKEGATGDFVLLQNVVLEVKGQKTKAGKSVVSTRFENAEKPFGEWNTVVITCSNGTVKQELNSKLVNEGVQTEISEGRILLQYEGYPIDFRKVNIKKL